MLSLHYLLFQTQPPLSSCPLKSSKGVSCLLGDFCAVFRKRKAYPFPYAAFCASPCIAYAAKRDSQPFEVDPDKAMQSLQELDQQLQSFSQKQVTPPPKITGPDLKFARNRMREEMPENSGSLLSTTAVVLFVISMFYNVLFYGVIKPAIDGQENISISSERESTEPAVMQQLPLSAVLESSSLLD